MKKEDKVVHTELKQLCESIRAMVQDGAYDECEQIIRQAMARFPHAPQPHNLLGIVMQRRGDHKLAMKHFRASWSLDPAYLPAKHNLNTYGTFFSHGKCAFDESDLVHGKRKK